MLMWTFVSLCTSACSHWFPTTHAYMTIFWRSILYERITVVHLFRCCSLFWISVCFWVKHWAFYLPLVNSWKYLTKTSFIFFLISYVSSAWYLFINCSTYTVQVFQCIFHDETTANTKSHMYTFKDSGVCCMLNLLSTNVLEGTFSLWSMTSSARSHFIVFISGSTKQQYSNTNMMCEWYVHQHLNTTMNQPTPDLAWTVFPHHRPHES